MNESKGEILHTVEIHSSLEHVGADAYCYCVVSGVIHDAVDFHRYLNMLSREGVRRQSENMIINETGLVKHLGLNEILEAMSKPYSVPAARADRNVAVIVNRQNQLVDNHMDHILEWRKINGRAVDNKKDAEAWIAGQAAAKRTG